MINGDLWLMIMVDQHRLIIAIMMIVTIEWLEWEIHNINDWYWLTIINNPRVFDGESSAMDRWLSGGLFVVENGWRIIGNKNQQQIITAMIVTIVIIIGKSRE